MLEYIFPSKKYTLNCNIRNRIYIFLKNAIEKKRVRINLWRKKSAIEKKNPMHENHSKMSHFEWCIKYILCPFGIKHLQIFLHNPNLFFLMRLIKILQDDSNVHVNDNHVIDDDKWDKVDDGHKRMTTITIGQVPVMRIAIRWGH